MFTALLCALASATTSTATLALIVEAERAVEACGLSKVIPPFDAQGGPEDRWSVERSKMGGAPSLQITVRVPGGKSTEWRTWLLAANCRAVGLRLDVASGMSEFLYRLDTPPSMLERGTLLGLASFERCDPDNAEHRPLPRLADFPPPSADADALPPQKAPTVAVLGPFPIGWRSGIYRDPRVCWQVDDVPPVREKSSRPSDFVAGGPRYRLVGVAGFQDGCAGLKGCQPFAIEVAGHRVRMLSTLGKPGMSLLVIEDQVRRRYATPFAAAGEARILGLYQGFLWIVLPVQRGPGFTLAALDLKSFKMWRVALEPTGDWSIAKTSATGLFVRDAELQEQYDEAEGAVDRGSLERKWPSVEVPWKILAAAIGPAH